METGTLWRTRKFVGDERPREVYEYTVYGTYNFPADMLRYDAAWPATGEDSYNMQLSYDIVNRKERHIKLRSYRAPAPGRWNSFSWYIKGE